MTFKETLQHKIDTKIKPLGSLGVLEKIAFKIGCIQQTTSPILSKPAMIVFAGDHGIVNTEPVSIFPQEVTKQMVYNIVEGKSAVNVFCNQHNIQLKIVDAGVNHNFNKLPHLIDAKINKGTANFTTSPAMSIDDCKKAINKGKELVTKQFTEGTNIISFGEMGIGATSSAALLMSAYTQKNIKNCIGKGTGLSNDTFRIKTAVLKNAQNKFSEITEPLAILATFGGYEIAMIAGAFIQAKALNMTILVDGFIVTAALLAAHAMEPEVVNNCIFTHCSTDKEHHTMLEFLKAEIILNLNVKLGAGTGPALVYPLIESSVRFLNEMASFKEANIPNKLS